MKKILIRQAYSALLPTLVNNVFSDKSIIELEKIYNKMYYKYVNSDLIYTIHNIAIYVKSLITLIRTLSPKMNALFKCLNNIVGMSMIIEDKEDLRRKDSVVEYTMDRNMNSQNYCSSLRKDS